jgi:VWFA-related protein
MRTEKRRLTTFLLVLALAGGAYGLASATGPQSEQRQGPIQPKPPQEEEAPYALRVEVPLVNVDVTVADRKGNIITGLRREQFQIFEDGAEQEIAAFAPTEAALTAVLLIETTPQFYPVYYDIVDAGYYFVQRLRKEDWVALVGFDLRPKILVDFTQDRRAILGGLRSLEFPTGFSEISTFDALLDTLDRLQDVEGKRTIIVIGTGRNTFGQHTWDDTIKRVRRADTGVRLFALNMSWPVQNAIDRARAYGYRGYEILAADYQMAEVQLRELATQTGGMAYSPRFVTEVPGIYEEISALLRNQYSLAYRPRDFKRDGKYHKIEVKLVGPEGQPLEVQDQKGKKVKYEIHARKGYYSPKEGG